MYVLQIDKASPKVTYRSCKDPVHLTTLDFQASGSNNLFTLDKLFSNTYLTYTLYNMLRTVRFTYLAIAFFVENVYIYRQKGIVVILPSRFAYPTELIDKSCPAATAFNIGTHVTLVIMKD